MTRPITAWKVSKYGVFLVRIFPHSDWIGRDTKHLSVFSPNAGKYGPEKTSYLDIFHTVHANENSNNEERKPLDQDDEKSEDEEITGQSNPNILHKKDPAYL